MLACVVLHSLCMDDQWYLIKEGGFHRTRRASPRTSPSSRGVNPGYMWNGCNYYQTSDDDEVHPWRDDAVVVVAGRTRRESVVGAWQSEAGCWCVGGWNIPWKVHL